MTRQIANAFTAWFFGLNLVFSGYAHQKYKPVDFKPIDEAGQDLSLKAFRDNLIVAVKQRNIDAVLSALGPDAKGFRIDLTRDQLRPAGRESSYSYDAWSLLLRALELGGTFTTKRGATFGRREFCAPYAYSAYPEIPFDLQQVVNAGYAWPVIGQNVAVREKPSITSRIIDRLDYGLVYVSDADIQEGPGPRFYWEMVKTPRGRLGYVESSFLWAPDRDWHVCFANVNDKWQISEVSRRSPGFSGELLAGR